MQSSLFDSELRHPGQPRVGHHHKDASKTELAAAKRQVQVGGKKRLEVLRHIVASGDTGLSRHEISEKFGIYLPTVCGRVRELLDGGWVYESGERQNRALLRATDRGRRAVSGEAKA